MIHKSKLSDLGLTVARLHFPGSIMAMVKTRLDKFSSRPRKVPSTMGNDERRWQ
jgi:hypothetical protein